MKEKRVFVVLLLLVILINLTLIYADTNSTTDSVDSAYSCLVSKLGSNCGNVQTTEEAAFNLLAISYDSKLQSDCRTSLMNKQKSSCWPASGSSACNVKSTAQAILALATIGENVDTDIEYILTKRKLTSDISWYLEIDSNNATTCKIKVNGANEKTFSIAEDKTISGYSACLSPSDQDYFLKIDPGCIDRTFAISCDKDFVTTLFYKKPLELTYHISSEAHAGQSSGSTQEVVNSYCFTSSSSLCDYEATLWATLALAKAGKDISPYLPYISAMADETENQKYLPYAFLYMLTKDDDYYSKLMSYQKQGSYWEESGKKLYDTALAILALQNSNTGSADVSKDYLLNLRESSGCWQSYTSFILYSGWSKNPTIPISQKADCIQQGNYCSSSYQCLSSDQLGNYYCASLSNVCCRQKPEEKTCAEKNGIECNANQVCSVQEIPSSDVQDCCPDTCEAKAVQSDCEIKGYSCSDVCSSTEQEETSYSSSCSSGKICCGEKTSSSGSGLGWVWIILLIILIILLVLAILFRNQLKIWWFKFRTGSSVSKGPRTTSRPFPPPGPGFYQRPRPMIPSSSYSRPLIRKPITPAKKTERDKDFEDTMKKLREMSK